MFLKILRAANIRRAREWFKDVGSKYDTAAFRALEHGGESGELQNIVKKLYRDDIGAIGNSESRKQLIANLRDEIGDNLITLDRVAESYGIDLEACTRSKFHKTSDKNKLRTKL